MVISRGRSCFHSLKNTTCSDHQAWKPTLCNQLLWLYDELKPKAYGMKDAMKFPRFRRKWMISSCHKSKSLPFCKIQIWTILWGKNVSSKKKCVVVIKAVVWVFARGWVMHCVCVCVFLCVCVWEREREMIAKNVKFTLIKLACKPTIQCITSKADIHK